jgi:serine-type D-Ala-D-Ala carboxypeptidase/endopeptidase (penicillin-binding protein 4)
MRSTELSLLNFVTSHSCTSLSLLSKKFHHSMLSIQLTRLTYVVSMILILSSCGIQQKIAKSAKHVINDSSLLTAHVGISIYEPASGKYWYNYKGDKYFVPASNTKIPTCYAAMKYLGDSLVGFRWEINDTMISILPSGDPSFLHPDFSSAKAIQLIKGYKYISLLANGYFANRLGSGWVWNDYQETYMAERSAFPMYGNVVKFYLKDDWVKAMPSTFEKMISQSSKRNLKGIRVFRPMESNDFNIFPGEAKTASITFRTYDGLFPPWLPALQAKLLADTLHIPASVGINSGGSHEDFNIFHSQPTDSLLKPMMHRSDNFFAEQSLLMVSNEMLGVMNDEMIIDTLLKTDFKDLPQKPRWADGSGLSRYNLFTPQDFVAILNKMKNEFGMERIKVILPTGGEGTISSYYKADSNFIFAKTGTLSGVVALSGFLYTKKGKLLIFSTLVNNHQASSTAVRRVVEKFIEGIRSRY